MGFYFFSFLGFHNYEVSPSPLVSREVCFGNLCFQSSASFVSRLVFRCEFPFRMILQVSRLLNSRSQMGRFKFMLSICFFLSGWFSVSV